MRTRQYSKPIIAEHDAAAIGHGICIDGRTNAKLITLILEADGIDGPESAPHPIERHREKREPQRASLGELLPLSKLKSGDEQKSETTRKTGCGAI